MRLILLIFSLGVLISTAGCGQKGDLFIPAEPADTEQTQS